MEKIMPGHLIGFGSVKDMWDCDDYSFTDAGMTEIKGRDIPTAAVCEKMVEELSGEVVV